MEYFTGKKVGILGLSVEGLDSVRFFLQEKSQITCLDRRISSEFRETYTNLQQKGVSFQLGPTYLNNLNTFDILVRTPGMWPKLPELLYVKDQGVCVTSATRLFFDLCKAHIIGVTGTKGKGTTSTLIYEMLKAERKETILGGNVGIPLLSKVREIPRTGWVVYELSSFQLEDLHTSPHIAVVHRITQEHLLNFDKLATNFHTNREAYVEAKKPIVRYQTKHDFAIINNADPTAESFSTLTPAHIYRFHRYQSGVDAYVQNHTVYVVWQTKKHRICTSSDIKLRGDHNLENIAAATLAALCAGVSISTIRQTVRKFEGLEHRLEFVRSVGNTAYYNDSFSTVPETTIAAVESFTEPIVLIVGGSDKGSLFEEMGKVIARSSVHTLIVIGQMTMRISEAVEKANYKGKLISGCHSMHEIIQTAYKAARPGDIVLLSPACASFDMFKNYKERGKLFKYEISLLS